MKTTKEILKWLQANHGKRSTGALTDHDMEALVAAVNMTPLISWAGAEAELFDAYRSIVSEMQPKTRWLAYQAIAMELDWGHRDMIWTAAQLHRGDRPTCVAAFEPGGSYQDQSKL